MTSIEIGVDICGGIVHNNSNHPKSHEDGENQLGYPLLATAAGGNNNNNTANTASLDSAQENHKQLTLMTHHDCGSNQSGSDSGLGYTNSLSSENNSLLANSADEPDQRAVNSVGRVDDECIDKPQGETSPIGNDQHRSRRHHEGELALLSSSLLCETSNEQIVLNTIDDTHISAKCPLSSLLSTQASLAAAQIVDLNNKFEEHNNATIESRGSHNNTNKGDRTRESRVSSSNIENVSSPPSSTSSLPLSRVKDEQRSTAESTSRTGLDKGLAKAVTSTPHHRHHHDHHPHNEETAASAAQQLASTTTTTAKIKHSSTTRHRPHETTSSMSTPSVTTTIRSPRQTGRDADTGYDDEIDKISEPERSRERSGARHLYPSERVSPSSVTGSFGGNLKSCIRSIAHPDKPIKRRNVSFNQTVIVFCEEIDASASPSDTFEPPLDYRDATGRSGNDQNDNAVCNSQGVFATTDDLEIINKIVGEDTSNLTDDQLIGLLESGSLLENFDLTIADKFTINHMNSGQSYLCHDAISDSDSESSLAEENSGESRETTHNQNKASSSTKVTQGLRLPAMRPEKGGNQALSPGAGRQDCTKISDRNDVQSLEESQFETIPRSGQQKSMPARVKVTPVESYNQHGKRVLLGASNQEDLTPATNLQAANRRQLTSSQSEQKVIPTSGDIQSNPPTVRQHFNTDPRMTSTLNGVIHHQNRDEQHHAPGVRDSTHIPPAGAESKSTGITTRYRPDQLVSWGASQIGSSQLNLTGSQVRAISSTSDDAHNYPACHVCRAIESSRLQANPKNGDRSALTTSNVQNPDSSLQRAPPLQTNNRPGLVQPVQSSCPPNHAVAVSSIDDPSVARRAQPVPACVSCQEISMQHQQRQQHHQMQQNYGPHPPGQVYGTQTMRPIPTSSTGQLPYQHPHQAVQQATRPIACQLVYVVDQHGNRVRALQVVRPKQTGVVTYVGPQQQQPQYSHASQTRANNYRFPNPTSVCNAQQINHQISGARPAGYNLSRDHAGQIVQVNPRLGTVDPKSLHRPIAQQIVAQSISENQRMQITNHSAPKNHTVYLVRQPLDLQDSRQASGIPSTKFVPRSSFPDAHEVRRLDGIKAQPVNASSSNQDAAFQRTTLDDANKRQVSNCKIDDADDPTFGFSQRPAVKVVATNAIQEPRGITKIHPTSAVADQRSQILTGSQTLGRRNVQRDRSLQRDCARESMPTTSSMSNINKTLSVYGPGAISVSGNQNVETKDRESRQITNSSSSAQGTRAAGPVSSNHSQLKPGTTISKGKPEVAYVLNI